MKKKLLAVEDAREFVELLRMALSPRGWSVVGMERLADALRVLREGQRFDAVLVDLVLVDALAEQTIAALPEIIALAGGARVVVATGIYPAPRIAGVAAVLEKGAEGAFERLFAAIRSE